MVGASGRRGAAGSGRLRQRQPRRLGVQGVADVRQAHPDHSLTRTEWQLTSVVEPSRTWRPAPEVDAVLRFDGQGHFSATVCNHYSGLVRIDGNLLQVRRMFGTQMGCGEAKRAVEEAFLGVVDGGVRWAINGDELRLDKPDGRGLRFRVRDTIYPSRELEPLLQGQRHCGDYRFGWQAGETGIGLEFEWRDGPGKPWGFAGMNRLPAWAVPGRTRSPAAPAMTGSSSGSYPDHHSGRLPAARRAARGRAAAVHRAGRADLAGVRRVRRPAPRRLGRDRLRRRRARAGTVAPAHVLRACPVLSGRTAHFDGSGNALTCSSRRCKKHRDLASASSF